MASIKTLRSGVFQLSIKNKLLPKIFWDTFDTYEQAQQYGMQLKVFRYWSFLKIKAAGQGVGCRDAVLQRFGVKAVEAAWKACLLALESHGASPVHIAARALPVEALAPAHGAVQRWKAIDAVGRDAASVGAEPGTFEHRIELPEAAYQL
jgi:hypothetical protein